MKLFYYSAVAAILFLASCSKKNNPTPVASTKTGTVVIGNQTYPTITIGSLTWTSFNYNGGTGALATPDPTYGNYYTLAQAYAITLPTGWRIPTRADYNNLLANFTSTTNAAGDYVGGVSVSNALADTGHFKGLASPTNSSGFSAYAGGLYLFSLNSVENQIIDGVFLTSATGTQNGLAVNYIFAITSDNVGVGLSPTGYYSGIDYNPLSYGYSLRFVKSN